MSNRSEDLLRAAARTLQEGGDPFSAEFLSEHTVKLAEALDLGQHIAAIIEAYLSAPSELRAQLMIGLVARDNPELVQYARKDMRKGKD
jgi:hypothetical protein